MLNRKEVQQGEIKLGTEHYGQGNQVIRSRHRLRGHPGILLSGLSQPEMNPEACHLQAPVAALAEYVQNLPYRQVVNPSAVELWRLTRYLTLLSA